MSERTATGTEAFTAFVSAHEQRLRLSLMAAYGPVVGRDAAVDALSWAWEHWDRVAEMTNPVGYLYRVGQTAAGKHLRSRSHGLVDEMWTMPPDVTPELLPALRELSAQQRVVVVLVHGYGISQREVAEMLELGVSTVREHLARAMSKLRLALGDTTGEGGSPNDAPGQREVDHGY
jgi:RNA polymerase sigma-70 factor (ECF subfamily)